MEQSADTERQENQAYSEERQHCQKAIDQLQRACRDARDLKIISRTDESVLEAVVRGVRNCKTGRLVNTFPVEFLCDVSGTSRSTFHRAIKRLEMAELIYMTTGSTGWRGMTDGYLAGIDVSPLMARAEELRAERKQQVADAVEESKLRQRLRGLKGQLRRCIERLGDDTAEFLDGRKLFDSIPLRFGKLSIEELRKFKDMIIKFLTMILGEPQQTESVSRPNMGHEARQTTPPTKDSNKKYICNEDSKSSLSESRKSEPVPPQNISLDKIVRLLTESEKQTVVDFSPKSTDDYWAMFKEIAIVRYVENGGSQETANGILAQLGLQHGTALLLLVGAKASTGRIQNIVGYAVGCTKKALMGTFDWKASLNSRAAQMAS